MKYILWVLWFFGSMCLVYLAAYFICDVLAHPMMDGQLNALGLFVVRGFEVLLCLALSFVVLVTVFSGAHGIRRMR